MKLRKQQELIHHMKQIFTYVVAVCCYIKNYAMGISLYSGLYVRSFWRVLLAGLKGLCKYSSFVVYSSGIYSVSYGLGMFHPALFFIFTGLGLLFFSNLLLGYYSLEEEKAKALSALVGRRG